MHINIIKGWRKNRTDYGYRIRFVLKTVHIKGWKKNRTDYEYKIRFGFKTVNIKG